MAVGRRKTVQQESMWIETARLARRCGLVFYERLNRLLAKHDFDSFVETLCGSFYIGTIGRKGHLNGADNQIPITVLSTGASLHDSQVAIPLATITASRVTSPYDLMDSAYDAAGMLAHRRGLGHRPIIDPAHRTAKTRSILRHQQTREVTWPEALRHRERTISERVNARLNARLKDQCRGRFVRMRGAAKVMAHLTFGVLALTVDQPSNSTRIVTQKQGG